jgi:hypothetical protein
MTDTPRTDAFCPNHKAAIADPTHAAKRASGLKAIASGLWERVWQKHPKISGEFFIAHEVLEVASDQMHKLETEVERLKTELADWDYGTRAKREQERAEKAEAGVDRLKAQLNRAIEIAEAYQRGNSGLHYQCNCASCQLLGDLKSELKL